MQYIKKKKRKRKKKFPVSFSIWDPIREKFPRNPLIIQLEYSQIIASRFQLSHRKQAQTSSLRQEVETLKARRTFFSLSLSLCLSRRKDFHLTTSSLCKCAIRKLERHARFIDTLLSFNLPTRASRPWFALGLPEKDPNVDVWPRGRPQGNSSDDSAVIPRISTIYARGEYKRKYRDAGDGLAEITSVRFVSRALYDGCGDYEVETVGRAQFRWWIRDKVVHAWTVSALFWSMLIVIF